MTTAVLCLSIERPATADENGAAHYPTGTNTVEPAIMPPVGGSLWLNYLTFYTADRFNNSAGPTEVPGYLVNAVAEAARMLHTWTSIDGVGWTSGVVIIANDANLRVPPRSGSGGGLGDLVIQPVLLTAAFGNLHVLGGRRNSMSYTRVKHSHFTARMAANVFAPGRKCIVRIVSPPLFIAIAVISLTGIVCSVGIRAELKAIPLSIRTHANLPNLKWSPSPEMRSNGLPTGAALLAPPTRAPEPPFSPCKS